MNDIYIEEPEFTFTPEQIERILKITGPPKVVSVSKAYSEYKKRLPWWRRIFWPRLNKIEKQMALLNYVLEQNAV